jgi:hypothetical protein
MVVFSHRAGQFALPATIEDIHHNPAIPAPFRTIGTLTVQLHNSFTQEPLVFSRTIPWF